MTELTRRQKEYITGLLLGDGCLYQFTPNSKPCLLITRSQKDIGYLEHNLAELRSLCKSGIKTYSTFDQRTQKTYHTCKIQTRNLQCLEQLYQEWYSNTIKSVPKTLSLTPLICAVWFCDDGCVTQNKNCRESRIRIKLATHGFTKTDTEFLVELLSNTLSEHFSTVQEKNALFIVGSDAAARAFISYTNSELPVSMERKYIWQNLRKPKTRSRPQLRNRNKLDLTKKEFAILQILAISSQEMFSPQELGNKLGWNIKGRAPSQIGYYLKRFLDRNWVIKTGVPHSYKHPVSYQITAIGKQSYETVSYNSSFS